MSKDKAKDKEKVDPQPQEEQDANECTAQPDMEQEETPTTEEENTPESEVERLQSELTTLQDDHLRLRAEYDNYRKRTLKEKSDLIKYGGEKIVTGFLDIMDDIELAIKNMSGADSVEGLIEGVEIIQNKFVAALKAQGVNAMEVVGKEFDADLHEAVAMVPTEDKEQKGKIIDCIQTGYTLNDKVIRHPKVVVGN